MRRTPAEISAQPSVGGSRRAFTTPAAVSFLEVDSLPPGFWGTLLKAAPTRYLVEALTGRRLIGSPYRHSPLAPISLINPGLTAWSCRVCRPCGLGERGSRQPSSLGDQPWLC